MGSSSSKSSYYPPAELDRSWRKVTWRERNQILPELESLTSSEVLKILLYGPTGAGKSSFVNSVQKALLGRNVISAQEQTIRSGKSFTATIKTHKMKKRGGGRFPFVFQDIMGLQPDNLGGIETTDVINILEGHISDGYTFNPLCSITKDHPKYNQQPNPDDKVHCLVCILPADCISRMNNEVFDKMRFIRKTAAKLNIPQVIVLTKVDQACEVVNKDLKKIYQSRKMSDKE
ncbi:interferon-induced protein 44-like isoform X2 [Salminus brasiliensis]|uniref:interferon-induced protein 44-like isoform X2 n=1 Tax=Salminus brasiliensis TaxID=930266 RepID=UPI003B8324E0